MSQYFRSLAAALVAVAASAALAQSTTGNTAPSTSNSRNIPGNADTGKAATTTGNDASKGTKGSIAAADRKFMEKAAAGGMAEVEMGKLAQQKGSSQQVKDFGARMEKDHGKANEELKQLASSKGVELPASTDKEHQSKMDKMQKLSGAAFDKAYMADMLADHKKDVADFRKESKSAKDPEVKAFAGKTLPTLEEHLRMAQDTDKSVRTASK
jgi:putative membrane protein